MHARVGPVLVLGLVNEPMQLWLLAAEALPGPHNAVMLAENLRKPAACHPGHERASHSAQQCVMPVTGRQCGDAACGKLGKISNMAMNSKHSVKTQSSI